MNLQGFKKYFEEMNPSFEKKMDDGESSSKPTGNDYIDTLEDEFGVKWKNLSSVLSSEPWVSTHFMLGKPDSEILYKISSWEVDPESLSPNGAYIRIKPSKGMRTYLKNGMLNKSMPDKNKYYLTRDELVKFLTTAWVPAPAPDAGGAMGGGLPMGGLG